MYPSLLIGAMEEEAIVYLEVILGIDALVLDLTLVVDNLNHHHNLISIPLDLGAKNLITKVLDLDENALEEMEAFAKASTTIHDHSINLW